MPTTQQHTLKRRPSLTSNTYLEYLEPAALAPPRAYPSDAHSRTPRIFYTMSSIFPGRRKQQRPVPIANVHGEDLLAILGGPTHSLLVHVNAQIPGACVTLRPQLKMHQAHRIRVQPPRNSCIRCASSPTALPGNASESSQCVAHSSAIFAC